MPSGFEMSSGEFTEDYTGEIADLVFMNGEYGTQALVTVALDNPITKRDGEIMNEKTIYLKPDAGWEADPSGELVNQDPTKTITLKSQWGKFANRVVELDEGIKESIVAAGGGTYSPKGWTGHRFHFMTEGQNPYTMPVDSDSIGWMTKKVENGDGYCTDETDTRVQGIREGLTFHGKSKGYTMPVEYLGTSGAPVNGQVGATAPASFSIANLPDDVIEAWGPLADTNDQAGFQKAVVTGGLLTVEKLGKQYGPVMAALGDGTLRDALSAV